MDLELNYVLRNTKCRQALMDLRTTISVPDWLDSHAALFKSISIAPAGRPSIASANYNGQHYEWIAEFHGIYVNLLRYVTMEV